MLLHNKTAIVYGAGPVGTAVAQAFAREGARVHLAGRTQARLDTAAETMRDVETAQVDVTDKAQVDAHAAAVASSGGLDVVFNATSNDDVQGTPLLDQPFDEFLQPVVKAVTAHHHIATAAAPHLIAGGGGAILVMAGGREAIPRLGGAHVAWTALTGLCRQLAAELGPFGVRVAWLLSPGSPDDDAAAEGDPPAERALLGRLPRYADVANAAAFLASDWARTVTAAELNLTGGVVID